VLRDARSPIASWRSGLRHTASGTKPQSRISWARGRFPATSFAALELDGVALEEIWRAGPCQIAGLIRHYVFSIYTSALAVPGSLHASLVARLDRVGPAKEVARSRQPRGASSPMLSHPPSAEARRWRSKQLGRITDGLEQRLLLAILAPTGKHLLDVGGGRVCVGPGSARRHRDRARYGCRADLGRTMAQRASTDVPHWASRATAARGCLSTVSLQ
jgi:hypothetical protein